MPKPDGEVKLWLYVRNREPPPRFTFFSGVYTFPWYPTVLRSWVTLSVVGLVWSALLSALLSVWAF